MKNDLAKKVEAVLFYLAEPVQVSFLAKSLDADQDDVLIALDELRKRLEERGLRIVTNGDEVSLATAPELSEVIEKIIKEERERDLGRAGIETLAIIAYKGPVSKKEIEYIRGVNSQWALRNLLLRGLIEKTQSKTDERVMVYSITSDTLRHLGVGSLSELPEYDEMKQQLEVVEETEDSAETTE